MSDIFREVDEEVRQDHAKKMWDRYGKYVIAMAVLIVAVVGGYKAFEYYSLKQLEKAGADYFNSISMLDDGKDTEALAAFQRLANTGSTGFALLSKFQEAGLSVKTGNQSEAVALYDELADDSSIDDSLRDLARMRAALTLSNTGSVKDVEARIGELAKTTSPWHHSAQEILAITAFRTGDIVRADKIFNELSADVTTPSAMRSRASAMVTIITPKLPMSAGKKQETKPDAQ